MCLAGDTTAANDNPETPAAAETEAAPAWNNFVHCKCGLACEAELGSWYVFRIGKGCGCSVCPDTNTTATTALRGSAEKPQKADVKAAETVESPEASQPKELPQPEQPEALGNTPEMAAGASQPKLLATWDGARVPATNLLYCSPVATYNTFACAHSWGC